MKTLFFENETQFIKIEVEQSNNFYFKTIYYKNKKDKNFKLYLNCEGIHEGLKSLQNSINYFIKKHNLKEIKEL